MPPIRHLTRIALVFAAVLLSGCSTLKGAKLLLPEAFGFVPIGPNLYVEPQADAQTRAQLLQAMLKAEAAMRASFGSVQSEPVVHACVTDRCLQAFGGEGTFAKVYGNRILLSSRGLNWNFIAHEWSHAELFKRLNLSAWRRMPQWFDEGLAVVVSEAPEHSEAHWQFLLGSAFAVPTRAELHTFRTLNQWLDAGRRYSDGKNPERRARGEAEIHILYSAAGHEVRLWFAKAGTRGVLAWIERLNAGQEFEMTYQAAD